MLTPANFAKIHNVQRELALRIADLELGGAGVPSSRKLAYANQILATVPEFPALG